MLEPAESTQKTSSWLKLNVLAFHSISVDAQVKIDDH